MKTKILALGLLLALNACASNAVEEATTPYEARSSYKVPVVYGVGFAAQPPTASELQSNVIGFGEYDPVTKRRTASCFGSNNTLWLHPPRKAAYPHEMHYHVLMVPPGYYALVPGLDPYEAKPSLMIKIEESYPQYLGDFWITQVPETDPHWRKLHPTKIMTLPVEYHLEQAEKILQSLEVPVESLKQIPLVPTDGRAGMLICAP